jgi:hypothetical protein
MLILSCSCCIDLRTASGATKKYYYALKNGPHINAEPGTPEFLRLYDEAVASLKERPNGTMRAMIDNFRDSDEFKSGSAHSRRAYERYLKSIDAKFGTMPIATLEDKRARVNLKRSARYSLPHQERLTIFGRR